MKAKALLDLKKNKQNLIIFFSAVIILFSFPLYDKFTKNYINESLKSSLITYALARSLNAGISVIKNSSIEAGAFVSGNVALGEVVDPINDAVERFSTLLTNALWVLGSEKVLYELSKLWGFVILILILAFLNIFINSSILKRLILILLFLRIYMPVSALIFHYLEKSYFIPQINQNLNIIKYTAQNNTLNSSSINKIKKEVKYYLQNSDKIIFSLLNIAAIFITKLIISILIIPLLFLYILHKIKLE
ncbi:conserved hypothetical protein [Lebetimonas natsushimae]|uniref:Uncharacterized protein n=1 Tax=Lebetimonas natsushimae TaxID=1936991 RepID=A0A292YGL2_9BACT|nr:hypothetical protein [Lebetimonas natsushimae]GAX88030.1 conserved hypothetical protein [Lebetimonas natsushimae]